MVVDDLILFIGTPKKLKYVRPGFCIDEKRNIIFKTAYSREGKDGFYDPVCYNETGEYYFGDYEELVYPIKIGQ